MNIRFERLRPDKDFMELREAVRSPIRSQLEICSAILKKHCAGNKNLPSDLNEDEARDAFNSNPRSHPLSELVQWALDSLHPAEQLMLVTIGGVEPIAMARHVRAHHYPLPDLVPFLNQFAAHTSPPQEEPVRFLNVGDFLPDARVWQ